MLLELKNLSAGYGNIHVLKDVNLELKEGEILALIGPNGAGKSTVLRSIFGLADIYSGDILYHGKSIRRLHTHDLIRSGISYVPQGGLVFRQLSVKENLEMGAYLEKDKKVVKKNVERLFAQFTVLEEKKHQKARNLSGGQQQILALARALMFYPKLLLLDEPSLGLSPLAIQALFDEILKIKREHQLSIIIVEQNVHYALQIANRGYVLVNGQTRFQGDPKSLLDREILRHLYLT